jgi:feruloyl esterase
MGFFFLGCAAGALGQAQSAMSPGSACERLRHALIAPAEIGLPTTGAEVTSARLKRSGAAEYCKVLGEIRPVSPTAQPIRFELNLPTQWNQKAVHYGGGSFDGALSLANGLATPEVGIKGDPTPLQRGFATFGSDSGHHHHYLFLPDALNALNSRFALNPEERLNFAHDALKKVHDVAVQLIQRRYGMAPRRMYFLGGSTGGREAYFVTQLWPRDYDGVLGAFAAWNQVELDLQFVRVSEAQYSKGGALPGSKTKLVAGKTMEACDAQDGLKDGILSNPAACHVELTSLACPAGGASHGCLTAGQLHTFQVLGSEQRTAEPLLHGVQSIPGYNVTSGTDFTGSMGLLHFPLHPPIFLLNSFYWVIADGVVRFFLTDNPRFNALTLNPASGGAYAKDLLPQSIESDASDADLTPFEQHGGKFLMLHGTADSVIPTNASVQFYRMMQAKMGQQAMDRFVRFYLIPGYGHGRGVFNAGFDALGVLDRWVEQGQAPEGLIATDNNKAEHGRTRPLCAYPSWPKYVTGDPNRASSFTCSQ